MGSVRDPLYEPNVICVMYLEQHLNLGRMFTRSSGSSLSLRQFVTGHSKAVILV